MDFSLSDDQQRFRDEVARFAERELNEDLIRRDADSEFARDAWKRCAAFGLQGLPVPEAYGGGGADALTTVVALEALGYGCRDNGLIFSLHAQMWSCEMPLVRFGTDDQKARWLPGLCDGSLIGVQCMTEPETGSDAYALRTTARRVDDGYVLDGSKTFITNAPVADVFVVFARTDTGEEGFSGLSAFLVERTRDGVSLGAPLHKMGLRTSPMSEVFFSDCRVPETALLGPAGAGMAVFNHSIDLERSFILASAVGSMQHQLEGTIAYAKERKQFGQPIGKFQAVSHKIVDMKMRVETARLLLYRLAWMKGRGRTSPLESAMVKAYVSEAYVRSSLDALQVRGGYGYMTEYEVEREVRDSLASRLYSGTSEIQRNIVAGYLGL